MGTYPTSRFLIVDAVQSADVKNIATDFQIHQCAATGLGHMRISGGKCCIVNERSEMSSGPVKVLVIAKEATIRSRLRRTLETLGFDAEEARDGGSSLSRFRTVDYEAILLEYRGCGVDGIALCKQLRSLYPRLPILVVTSSSSLNRKLATFEAGADDCMTRPLAERELGVRLRSAIRRIHASSVRTSERFVIGEIALDRARRRVEKSGSHVSLTPTEFRALETLMGQPGIPVPHSTLVNTMWGLDSNANREHLRVVIRGLRKKLEDDASEPRYLITHAYFGYEFCDH
jgi:two-component system KDP operon response regulator KdpE